MPIFPRLSLCFILVLVALSALARYPDGTSPLPDLAAPTPSDRILVVAPHPDDETVGAGGYLAEAARVGATVRIVVATDGGKRGGKKVRYPEIRNAIAKLGLPADALVFLNFPDGRLGSQATFQDRLNEQAASFHPNIVIGTHPLDGHPDHAAVGRAIQILGEHSDHSITAYFFVVHYPHYPSPDAYRPDAELPPPPRFVDKASTWESWTLSPTAKLAKRDAILEYHSQILPRNPLRRGLLISFIRKNEVFAVRSF